MPNPHDMLFRTLADPTRRANFERLCREGEQTKIWRALTQPHLIEEWLMKNDFKPVVGHHFNLRGDWGTLDCQIMAVEPNKTLSYTWNFTTMRPTI